MKPLTIRYLLIPLLATLLLLGCAEEEKVQPETPEGVQEFTPPADGKITPGQAEAYVKASLALTRALKKQEKVVRAFTEKHKLKDDLSELGDSAFMNDHPRVASDWDELTRKWGELEKEAYKEAGITEEEFNWVGGALTDTLNRDVQKEIAAKLTTEME